MLAAHLPRLLARGLRCVQSDVITQLVEGPRHVRFTPKSRHCGARLACPLCAKSRHSGRFWILLLAGKGAQVRGASPVKLPRRNFLHLPPPAAALPAVLPIARAHPYPSRPVRLIVPPAPA